MMCILDADLCFRQMSRGWDVLGFDRHELLGRPLLDLVHPDDRISTREKLVGAQRPEGSTFESRVVSRQGAARWLLWNASMPGDDGLVYGAARDISDLKETQRVLEERTEQLDTLAARLRDSAFTDALTGLRNRRYFQDRIDEDVAVVRRAYAVHPGRTDVAVRNADLGVLMLDLDRFKAINDEHGHASGDAVLMRVAQRIRSSIREVDTAVRWGGEEFLVVLRQADAAYVSVVAGRIRKAIGATPCELPDGSSIRVTCSMGYSCYPLGPLGLLRIDDVIRVADAALYIAKHEGRDRVVGIAAGEREMSAHAAAVVRTDVAAALAGGHLLRVPCEASPRP
jgi:diguanylate cyclase (GGDEF)-like protein/PAS domain S-box-containing protein